MKKVTKVFSVMVASVALAAMLSGCGGDKKPAGGDTIKVGGNLEMTGGSASFGISSKNAIELAFKNINDKGGINGKKLELVVADNKSEAAEATMPCRSWSLRTRLLPLSAQTFPRLR